MFGKKVLHVVALAAAVLVVWSVAARPSGAHGPKTYYRVEPSDTLWSIAQSHYGGDVRNAVWKIQHVNHLGGSEIAPGQRLLLP
jgi:nucleoid-associated protein YgaU